MFDLKNFIPKNHSVVVISAAPCDADSLASGIILVKYLKSLGYQTQHYFPRAITGQERDYLDWLPHFGEITFADTRPLFAPGNTHRTLITVDGRDRIQFYDYQNIALPEPDFSNFSNILRIHHHTRPDNDITKNTLGGNEISSTVEVLLTGVIPPDFMTPDLAICAYAGLVDDTGNFQWNFTSQTHELASWLCTFGIDGPSIAHWVMHTRDESFYQALSYAVDHKTYYPKIRTVILSVSQKDQRKYHLTTEFLKSLVFAFNTELAKKYKNCDRGLLIIEYENSLKITGRGQGTNKISLPELLRPVGSQGKGHFNATNFDTPEKFIPIEKKIVKLISSAIKSNA